MSKQVQIRVSEETHTRIKQMASAVNMSMQEFLEQIFADEWEAFNRKDVQYALLKKRIQDRSIEE